eukprot:8452357-Heterocapsa_arctica.AAC.1
MLSLLVKVLTRAAGSASARWPGASRLPSRPSNGSNLFSRAGVPTRQRSRCPSGPAKLSSLSQNGNGVAHLSY